MMSITDSSRASTPTQGPSTTPLPTNPRRLNIAGCQWRGCVLTQRQSSAGPSSSETARWMASSNGILSPQTMRESTVS